MNNKKLSVLIFSFFLFSSICILMVGCFSNSNGSTTKHSVVLDRSFSNEAVVKRGVPILHTFNGLLDDYNLKKDANNEIDKYWLKRDLNGMRHLVEYGGADNGYPMIFGSYVTETKGAMLFFIRWLDVKNEYIDFDLLDKDGAVIVSSDNDMRGIKQIPNFPSGTLNRSEYYRIIDPEKPSYLASTVDEPLPLPRLKIRTEDVDRIYAVRLRQNHSIAQPCEVLNGICMRLKAEKQSNNSKNKGPVPLTTKDVFGE